MSNQYPPSGQQPAGGDPYGSSPQAQPQWTQPQQDTTSQYGYGAGQPNPYGSQQAPGYGAQDPYAQTGYASTYPQAQGQQGYPQAPQTGYADPYGQQPYAAGYGQPPYAAPQPVLVHPGTVVGRPVSWVRRAQGFLLDWVLPSIVLGMVLGLLISPVQDGHYNGGYGTGNFLSFLLIALYNGFMTKNGQTPGRRWAGTRLVDKDTGAPIEGGRAVLRAVTHYIDNLLLGLGWLLPLIDGQRQTIADKLNRTIVVDAAQPPAGGTPPYQQTLR